MAEPPKLDAEQRHQLIAEYQVGVQMAIYESQLFWTITTAFVISQTLLAGFIFGAEQGGENTLRFIGALGGAVISWVWLAAAIRSARYNKLRIHQSRELERKLGASLFIDGEPFAKGEVVDIDGQMHRQPWYARFPTIKQSAFVLAVAFGSMFVGAIWVYRPAFMLPNVARNIGGVPIVAVTIVALGGPFFFMGYVIRGAVERFKRQWR